LSSGGFENGRGKTVVELVEAAGRFVVNRRKEVEASSSVPTLDPTIRTAATRTRHE